MFKFNVQHVELECKNLLNLYRFDEMRLMSSFPALICARISLSVETVNLGNGGPRGEVTISQVRCFHGLIFTGETSDIRFNRSAVLWGP